MNTKKTEIKQIAGYTPTRVGNGKNRAISFGCGAVRVTQQTLEETISYLQEKDKIKTEVNKLQAEIDKLENKINSLNKSVKKTTRVASLSGRIKWNTGDNIDDLFNNDDNLSRKTIVLRRFFE